MSNGNKKKIWDEANTTCVGMGGSLASSDIVKKASALLGNSSQKYWVGLRRYGNGNIYEWNNGEIAVTYTPNIVGDKCTYIKDGINLESESCTTEKKYICQKSINACKNYTYYNIFSTNIVFISVFPEPE